MVALKHVASEKINDSVDGAMNATRHPRPEPTTNKRHLADPRSSARVHSGGVA
jgi:hypothetical protein